MEEMIFALEAVLPFVFMLACGYFLKRRGILTENFRQQGDALCFRFLFPVLVFQNIYTAEMPETSIWRPIWFAIGVMVSSLLIFWLAVPRLEKDHRKIPVIIQSLYRGNFMIYGIPFSLRLGGEEAALIATAMTAVTLPLLNIAAIATYARYTEGEKVRWKDTVMQILKNPIIWGVLLGVLFFRLQIPIWEPVESCLADIAKIATPLSFLLLGSRLSGDMKGADSRTLFYMILVKQWVMPAIYLFCAMMIFHFSSVELVPVLIFLTAPGAITTYQLAIQFRADDVLAGAFVLYSMVVSVVSIFLFVMATGICQRII